MTALTDARVRPEPGRGPSLVRIYRTEAFHEFLKLIRVPMFAVSTLVFPLMFYVIFGITFADETAGGVGVTTYMLATYGAFGVIGAALFGFGASIATERGQGWMRLKRVSPMPPLAYFVGEGRDGDRGVRADRAGPLRARRDHGRRRDAGHPMDQHWRLSSSRVPCRSPRWGWRSGISSGPTRLPPS